MSDGEEFVDRLKRCLDHMDENNEIEIVMDREGLEECITALQTIQRIEGLAKQEAIISFSKGRWCVETSRTPGGEFVGFYAATLPLAVEAAEGGK